MVCSGLTGITIGDWQNIRCSGKTSANQVYVRLENDQSSASENTLLYYNGTEISEHTFATYSTDPGSYQASYPSADMNYDLGLVSAAAGQSTKINPVYYGGSGMPSLAQMTRISTDPANDQGTNHLDIVADYFTYSDTKFYGAIQNRGGGFPQTGALGFPPYYSYMVVIADPLSDHDDPNTIVWAMNYMSVVFGGIAPGLYKITGTGADALNRIGDITSEIVSGSNLLKMSCDIAPLLADPDFTAWYNTNGHVIGVVSMSSKTTLSGLTPVTATADLTAGADVHLTRFYNQLDNNILPQVENFVLSPNPGDIHFSCNYTDAQGRFPLSIQAEFSPGQTFTLYPQAYDHSQTVLYRSLDLSGTLSEYDEVPCRASASLDDINWAYSSSQPISYILGLQPPANLSVHPNTTSLDLMWDPVDLTLLGNPVEPDYYLVEFDEDPSFGSPRQLDPVYDTNATVEITPQRQFYRVRAFKAIP